MKAKIKHNKVKCPMCKGEHIFGKMVRTIVTGEEPYETLIHRCKDCGYIW